MKALLKRLIPHRVFQLIEPTGHQLEAMLAAARYGFPAHSLKVVGVTGTDGKTTTSTIIASILRAAGYKTALLTTVSFDVGQGEVTNETRMTTLSARQLNQLLRQAVDNGVEWVVLETTSHALAQRRVWGVPYHIAILTNITHEHLDYHGTMERYVAAKRRLFELANKNSGGTRTGVLPADSQYTPDFSKAVAKTISYGKGGDVAAANIELSHAGGKFTLVTGSHQEKINLNLVGSFNVDNALAASATAIGLGIDPATIKAGIEAVKSVAGRMEAVETGTDFGIVIDFAHTPEAFEKVLGELSRIATGKLIAVFGCPGERDPGKRPMQGAVAGRLCGRVILTEDDPRSEQNEDIMEQIAAGIREAGGMEEEFYEKIADRQAAVDKAVAMAQPGDIVVLLSKGDEKSIVLADGVKKPWDEYEAAKEALAKRKGREPKAA